MIDNMSTLKVSIIKSEVLVEVGRQTGYIGKKTDKDDGTYDKVAAIEPDNAMLGQFWNEGTNIVVNEMKSFRGSFCTSDNVGENLATVDGFFAECTMNDNWNTSLEEFVNTSIFRFLVNYIVYRWFMLMMRLDDAMEYDKIANAQLSKAIECMYETKRPSHGYNRPIPEGL